MDSFIMKDLIAKAGTRYRLVIMTQLRAKEILLSHKPSTPDRANEKPINGALREISEDLITFKEIKKSNVKKAKVK